MFVGSVGCTVLMEYNLNLWTVGLRVCSSIRSATFKLLQKLCFTICCFLKNLTYNLKKSCILCNSFLFVCYIFIIFLGVLKRVHCNCLNITVSWYTFVPETFVVFTVNFDDHLFCSLCTCYLTTYNE